MQTLFALLVLWNAEVPLNRIYNPRKGTKSSDISISVAKLQEDLKFMKILKESQKIFPENYHHDRHNFAAYQWMKIIFAASSPIKINTMMPFSFNTHSKFTVIQFF